MLSRKLSGAGMMSAAAGTDRSRVGERLQAALAGLQELHLLRDRHSDMVSWALRAHREEPVTSVRPAPHNPAVMGAEEQRLEATLTALKQQLSRLRKQDVGLKTHLQQLDQQISELKLDVSKVSSEQQESDSRPSSGFYELSDGGSFSLSNSCTSVYSECLSSSQTSLLLPPMSPASSHNATPTSQGDACRRHSGDEIATQANPPRVPFLHLGSSRIRTSTMCSEQARPRPVSTGDLDREMTHGPGNCKHVDGEKSPVCSSLKTSTVNPKYQINLVSRSGNEVYHYPSPLHAVALQSPIFSHGVDLNVAGLQERHGTCGNGVTNLDTLQREQMASETKTHGYIGKLLQRGVPKVQIEPVNESVHLHSNYDREHSDVVVFPDVSQVDVQVLPDHMSNIIPMESCQSRRCTVYTNQEQVNSINNTQLASQRCSNAVATREYSSDEVTQFTLRKNDKVQRDHASAVRSHSGNRYGDILDSHEPEKKGLGQRPVIIHSSSTEESQSFESQTGHTGSPEFVHAKFVPAGSQKVKVRQADRKTKAVKLRRKSSEKPRVARHQHGYSSGEKVKESSGGTKGEQRKPGKVKASHERRHGSGSDSSLCSPGVMHNHKVYPKPHPVVAPPKQSRNRRTPLPEYEQFVDQRKRRPVTAKWAGDMEMFQTPASQHHRSRENHVHASGSRQVVRSVSSRAQSGGQWIGRQHPFQSPMSASSFYHSLNARYPAAPYHMSSIYPPRCESEYSAECASLFHSTIAESSEGELSDNTTNRFGDSESSHSFQSLTDSDSSLSQDEGDQVDEDEGGLVWAEATLGPTAAGLPLQQVPRPEPPTCRIKASRALKKKIRRFQPASLKVMTLV